MTFKRVSGARKYFKYAECAPGQKLIENGVYLGPEDGKFGIQHLFRGTDGVTTVLNSAGHLNWLLKAHVTAGQRVNVTYVGKDTLPGGKFEGKEAHGFELDVDDDPATVVTAKGVADALAAESATPDISL